MAMTMWSTPLYQKLKHLGINFEHQASVLQTQGPPLLSRALWAWNTLRPSSGWSEILWCRQVSVGATISGFPAVLHQDGLAQLLFRLSSSLGQVQQFQVEWLKDAVGCADLLSAALNPSAVIWRLSSFSEQQPVSQVSGVASGCWVSEPRLPPLCASRWFIQSQKPLVIFDNYLANLYTLTWMQIN